MSSAPVVPHRPARSPNREKLSQQTVSDTPKIPPRPQRTMAKSQSREREAYARSPFNEAPLDDHDANQPPQSIDTTVEAESRAPDVASLPLVGQEGIEYASLNKPKETAAPQNGLQSHPKDAPEQTSNVASDLPLHAPKASASAMTQKSRVAAVTRTDTEKASVIGIGKPKTEYAKPEQPSPVGQYRPPSAVSTERPSSSQAQSMLEADEQGIPSFGGTVPLYPNAGDVQAPTPAPGSATTPVFGDISRPETSEGHHRNAHGFHGPPGSYGLHGHGVAPHDKFERAWYQRHPEELAKEEEGAHHPAAHDERPESALTSEELNRLVHGTGRNAIGMGTQPEVIGTPTEAIGYQATEEYASRSQSPQTTPPPSARLKPSRPSSQSYTESPLKKTISASELSRSTNVAESEGNEEKVHVVPPTRPTGKYSGAGYDPPTENLGPTGGNTEELGGYINERGEGVPILASDEIAKYPAADWMQPAVSPAQQITEDDYYSAADSDHQPQYRSSHSRSRSKGHSRPSSLHSASGLARYGSHDEGAGTPLEEIEEYEPLFNDDDDEETKRSKVQASKAGRPNTLRKQHFPSRDIWEDAPNSLQLETTVETPEPAVPKSDTTPKNAPTFELPEKEQLRKAEFIEPERREVLHDSSKAFAKPKFNASIQEDRPGRPGMRQRFPSQDIWEDTPDSLRLETTVGQNEAANVDAKSPESKTQKPVIPARPTKAKPEEKKEMSAVPARPQARDVPGVPDRPKPSVPHRPARSMNQEQPGTVPLTKTISGERNKDISGADTATAPSIKPKPTVPARPAASSKFASIKAGFMSDLNSRLSKGPAASKPQQEEAPKPEEEKPVLSDARKGRARGPARRKPAVSPAPSSETTVTPNTTSKSTVIGAWNVWSIDADEPGRVNVSVGVQPKALPRAQETSAQFGELPTSSPLSTNTAGESLLAKTEAPQTKGGHLAHAASPAMDARAHRESDAARERMRQIEAEHIGHEGDVPEPIVDQPTAPLSAASTKSDSKYDVGAESTEVEEMKREAVEQVAPVAPPATKILSPMETVSEDDSAKGTVAEANEEVTDTAASKSTDA